MTPLQKWWTIAFLGFILIVALEIAWAMYQYQQIVSAPVVVPAW